MNCRDSIFRLVVKPFFHKVMCPSLFELSGSGFVSTDVSEILTNISHSQLRTEDFFEEFKSLAKELMKKYDKNKLNYPETYNISESSAFLLYCMVRAFGPENVLETGVANGISSYYILNAMNRNCKGTLYSIDIDSNVGGLLGEDERRRWQLRVISKKNAAGEFKDVISALPQIDIFIHDSDHSYTGQMLEYEAVYSKVSDEGILSSDDIDFSYAFNDFCKRKHYTPSFLVTSTKVFGVLKKSKCQS